MAKLYIGTSGYAYPHWRNGVFYPEGLSQKEELEYYSRHFESVELNNTFYWLPKEKTFSNWVKRVPPDFIFTVKVSRFITHVKKLENCQRAWQIFLARAKRLGKKLGPFLFQFPPNWEKDLERLEKFLDLLEKTDKKYRYVFEFRHLSWFSQDLYQLLKKYKNATLCLANSPRWPFIEVITGDFVYIRMHGGKILYSSNYSERELRDWGEKIKKYLKEGLDVYVYFNNDAFGYAIKNAMTLKRLLT